MSKFPVLWRKVLKRTSCGAGHNRHLALQLAHVFLHSATGDRTVPAHTRMADVHRVLISPTSPTTLVARATSGDNRRAGNLIFDQSTLRGGHVAIQLSRSRSTRSHRATGSWKRAASHCSAPSVGNQTDGRHRWRGV